MKAEVIRGFKLAGKLYGKGDVLDVSEEFARHLVAAGFGEILPEPELEPEPHAEPLEQGDEPLKSPESEQPDEPEQQKAKDPKPKPQKKTRKKEV